MHSVTDESTLWIPNTEEEKEMVRVQMHRLLETSHFKNSRRYPALFRFIVEEALEGRGEFLKERLLGVRVFDRPADYDTASDPIVRVTIAEIRKRIAQYYHEEAHETEMRIELLPGHYEPEFRPRREVGPDRVASATMPALNSLASHAPITEPSTFRPALRKPAESALQSVSARPPFSRRVGLGVFLGLFVCAAIVFFWHWSHPSAVEAFWAPVVGSHRTVTFCLPNGAGRIVGMALAAGEASPETNRAPVAPKRTPTFLDHESLGENVVFSDALATLRISNLMATYNRESRFRLNVSTSLDDLREGPSVLIGGMDNQWTLRAIAPLRFHFAGNDEETYWIMDTKNPSKKDWGLDLKTQYAVVNRDYAIIARIHDEATGELEVIVAGIGMSGTAAAGEFLVDPHQLEELRRRVGSGFRDHDFEAVLSTDVVNGIAGSPRILTVAVW